MKHILMPIFIVLSLTGCATTYTPETIADFWETDADSLSSGNSYKGNYFIDTSSDHCLSPKGQKINIEICKKAIALGPQLQKIKLSSEWQDFSTFKEDKIKFPQFHLNDKPIEKINSITDLENAKNEIATINYRILTAEKIGQMIKEIPLEGLELVPKLTKIAADMFNLIKISDKEYIEAKKLKSTVANYELKSKKQDEEHKIESDKFLADENAFMASQFSKYDLTKNEFEMDIARSDAVLDWGLNLGSTLFRISRSRATTIQSHSTTKGKDSKSLVITLKTNNNKTDIVLTFVVKKQYVVLASVFSSGDNQTFYDVAAEAILSTVVY